MNEPTSDMMLSGPPRDPDRLLGSDPRGTAAPGRRVGDAERAACCETLADHFAAGRLRGDELELRLDAAVRAVTEGDLRRLVADLPTVRPETPPSTTTAPGLAASGPGSPVVVVLAVVVLVLGGLLAGGLLLVLGAVNPLLFLGACLGGAAAFAVGASATVLWHQARQCSRNVVTSYGTR